MDLINLAGKKFGRLQVIERSENIGPHTGFKCLCDCGVEKNVRSVSLRRGDTTSCGCVRSEKMKSKQTIHGYYKSPTYNSYRSMLARCSDSKHPQYKDYGERGIGICAWWLISFQNFLTDMGERPAGKTLDRINNDEGYCPSNCKWSTRKEQNNNKRRNNYGSKCVIN